MRHDRNRRKTLNTRPNLESLDRRDVPAVMAPGAAITSMIPDVQASVSGFGNLTAAQEINPVESILTDLNNRRTAFNTRLTSMRSALGLDLDARIRRFDANIGGQLADLDRQSLMNPDLTRFRPSLERIGVTTRNRFEMVRRGALSRLDTLERDVVNRFDRTERSLQGLLPQVGRRGSFGAFNPITANSGFRVAVLDNAANQAVNRIHRQASNALNRIEADAQSQLNRFRFPLVGNRGDFGAFNPIPNSGFPVAVQD